MKYMAVEHFRNGDPLPVYRRFRDRGRMAPDGLQYLSSWPDQTLLNQWITNWNDIVDFEIFRVVASAEAAQTIAPQL